MKRILMMVFRNLFYVPILWIRLCYHAAHVDKYTEAEHYKLLRLIDKRANIGGNVHVKVYGEENIPKEDGFMFFANHQGLYDVLAIIEVFPRPFSVVAKKEIGRIPFLKQVFACMKAYLLDREDVRQAAKVICAVSDEVQQGRNYLIFPEGTRSRQGNRVGEFKGGSFKAATRAACPIVPVALVDAFRPFDTNSIRPVEVQVHFLPPLYPQEYEGMKTVEIAALVQESVQQKIWENCGDCENIENAENH